MHRMRPSLPAASGTTDLYSFLSPTTIQMLLDKVRIGKTLGCMRGKKQEQSDDRRRTGGSRSAGTA